MSVKQPYDHIRRKRVLIFGLLTISLSIVFMLISLCGIWLDVQLPTLKHFFEEKYVYRVGSASLSDRNKALFRYSSDTVCRNGQMYLNFSYVAEQCGFAVSGDYVQFRYLVHRDDESDLWESLIFNVDSSYAEVSGQKVSMSAPAVVNSNRELFLPCDFVTNYIHGIQIEMFNVNDRTIVISLDENGDFSLALHEQELCFPIDPYEVPVESTENESK